MQQGKARPIGIKSIEGYQGPQERHLQVYQQQNKDEKDPHQCGDTAEFRLVTW